MKLRQLAAFGLVLLVIAGCRREAPAEAPEPADDTDAAVAEQARADSLAALEREEREARDRAEAAARAEDILTRMVHFELDSERLSSEAQSLLRQKADILSANSDLRIRVEGHADERGSTEYNLALGQRRAESVRSFLEGHGVSSDRITTLSYGKERPLETGSNERAWDMNRRGEFVVTAGDISTIPSDL